MLRRIWAKVSGMKGGEIEGMIGLGRLTLMGGLGDAPVLLALVDFDLGLVMVLKSPRAIVKQPSRIDEEPYHSALAFLRQAMTDGEVSQEKTGH